MSESPLIWISDAGTMYRVRMEYRRAGPAILLFERVGGGWERSVPIHPSVVLSRLNRAEIEELLSEAMES